ncbi:MAG TPA: hypothetical protein ENH07_04390 [Nitrospirae bacterium]|nr:sporulation and spore germination [bacterium BMS3Abin07]GBE32956.1 sporulation and spore germination [bacterium BMS3Bbin05]HDO35516.1 hypothetical protein [Nitrospirota bacterium]
MKDNRYLTALISILFILVLAGGYIYLIRMHPPEIAMENKTEPSSQPVTKPGSEEHISIKLFFPEGHKLVMEEREIPRVFSQKKILREVIREFLKGPAGTGPFIMPEGVILLSVYIGSDGVAYIDLSEDLRRNFHGDAIDEYLLLKGIYESTISNIKINDVKILIDDKEVDTIGGHFYANRPLKQLVTQEIKFD